MNGGKSKGYTDTCSCAEKRLSLTSYLLVSILSSETHANMKHSSSQKMIKKKVGPRLQHKNCYETFKKLWQMQ
jgi:hypothetical protein